MSMFGVHLAVLRQPLQGGGPVDMPRRIGCWRWCDDLPDGSALALVEERPSRDITKPPALLKRLAEAVKARGGTVEEHGAPRRGELRALDRRHAARIGVKIELRAAHVLAERIGGADLGDRCRARRDDAHRRLGAAQAGDLRRRRGRSASRTSRR